MKLDFEVGQQERHQVVFVFDKFWGGLSISVDGQKVVQDRRMYSVSTVKTYELEVGDQEKHQVRIDQHRKLFAAGFRPQPVKAYVDGELVAEGVA